MGNILLIDAAYPEITRVAEVEDGKVVGFNFESNTREQLTGNIYLARAVRIEAALQAVFVEYGGNKDGFLPLSEIHPDYYNIPIDEQLNESQQLNKSSEISSGAQETEEVTVTDVDEIIELKPGNGPLDSQTSNENTELFEIDGSTSDEMPTVQNSEQLEIKSEVADKNIRKYRVQEVIRKDQILLVQVVKNERGNKGAALSTYISLAGRYCVLMPNSNRLGGISRKITDIDARRKLKKIVDGLNMPKEAGLIIRTAGTNRTKQEIQRDYDFLAKQWNQIRDLTLKSIAPTKIHEEGNLIRRSIRDDYSKEMNAVIVQGESGYKTAKSFMKLLIPSHARKVKQHTEPMPIFSHYGIENEIKGLLSSIVQLNSGGYIVIDRTEALIAIDVNSGRAIRESTLEKTALKTNLEAVEVIAMQMRLRDLAGLIVIDFIDMEQSKNNITVERKLKECVKSDRSRIQIGRISRFGLLEMSRQRLKPGIYDIATTDCTKCNGSGRIRSDNAFIIDILREIEIQAVSQNNHNVIEAIVPLRIVNLFLNKKRAQIQDVEKRHGITLIITGTDHILDQELEIRLVNKTITSTNLIDEQVIASVQPFLIKGVEAKSSGHRSDRTMHGRKQGKKQFQSKRHHEGTDSEDSNSHGGHTKRNYRRGRFRYSNRHRNRSIESEVLETGLETVDLSTANQDQHNLRNPDHKSVMADNLISDSEIPHKPHRRGSRRKKNFDLRDMSSDKHGITESMNTSVSHEGSNVSPYQTLPNEDSHIEALESPKSGTKRNRRRRGRRRNKQENPNLDEAQTTKPLEYSNSVKLSIEDKPTSIEVNQKTTSRRQKKKVTNDSYGQSEIV